MEPRLGVVCFLYPKVPALIVVTMAVVVTKGQSKGLFRTAMGGKADAPSKSALLVLVFQLPSTLQLI